MTTSQTVTVAWPVTTSEASVAATIAVKTTETATSTSHGRARRKRRGAPARGGPSAAGALARPIEGPRSSITRLVS